MRNSLSYGVDKPWYKDSWAIIRQQFYDYKHCYSTNEINSYISSDNSESWQAKAAVKLVRRLL